MVADQRRDRTRMGDGRTAAPAGAPPLRPALVAQPGAGDRQRAGVAVRAGARAEAADPLRRPRSEARRVGKACVSTCISQSSPFYYTNKQLRQEQTEGKYI